MQNRQWVFGANAGIKFSPTPAPFANLPIDAMEGCASIATTKGQLLLYSDGVTVWDAAGTVKLTGLSGNVSSTQAALVVPDPASKERFYVFTSDGTSGGNKHVNGVRIDTANWSATPLSALMAMPTTSGFSPTEKLVAIRHANKKDFWVATVLQAQTSATANAGPGVLRFFRVATTGVSYAHDRHFGYPVSDAGYMKASVGGAYIAIANHSLYTVLLIPFSPLVAAIGWPTSHSVTVPPSNDPGYPYGLEFSPDGKMLYYSTVYPVPWWSSSPTSDGHVFQYVLPNGPRVHLGARPAASDLVGALQLGPDGRIYIAQAGATKIGVIAKPNVIGAGCALAFGALPLASGSVCRLGLPNLIRDLF